MYMVQYTYIQDRKQRPFPDPTPYTGDFLEEDLYSDWSASLREEARATYVSIARALTSASWPLSPFRGGTANPAGRSYATYVSKMEELGVEPAAFLTSRAA